MFFLAPFSSVNSSLFRSYSALDLFSTNQLGFDKASQCFSGLFQCVDFLYYLKVFRCLLCVRYHWLFPFRFDLKRVTTVFLLTFWEYHQTLMLLGHLKGNLSSSLVTLRFLLLFPTIIWDNSCFGNQSISTFCVVSLCVSYFFFDLFLRVCLLLFFNH